MFIVSSVQMVQIRVRSKLDRLLAKIPDLGDILRGSLIHRKTFHSKGCAKCQRGDGHPQWVLNVNYPGGKNRQISLHRDQLPKVRRQLRNFHQLKKILEAICELSQLSLRPDDEASFSRRNQP
jgi:hypothetical protein